MEGGRVSRSAVSCVMVSFEPKKEVVLGAISSLVQQVGTLYLVDNGSMSIDVQELVNELPYSNIELILLGSNLGIAAAQNKGLSRAIENGYEFVVLSDQDTVYGPVYVAEMLPAFASRQRIAAVVPRILETNRGREDQGFIVFEGFRCYRRYPKEGLLEVTQAIASGKIISTEALKVVGMMDESLFIDWVDLEWCWRARCSGFSIIGNASVVVEHTLGDTTTQFAGAVYSLRSPLRHYYIVRNAVYLALRSSSINWRQRIHLLYKSVRYLFGYPLLCRPRMKHLSFCVRGFIDGLAGVTGKYREKKERTVGS